MLVPHFHRPFHILGINFPPTVGKNSRDTRSRPLIRGHVGSHRRNQELPQNSGHAGAFFREIHGTAGHISLGKPCDSMVFVGYAMLRLFFGCSWGNRRFTSRFSMDFGVFIGFPLVVTMVGVPAGCKPLSI